jgi:hypothetical protein
MTVPSPAIHPEASPIRVPTSAATLQGFRRWATSDEFPERGRIPFIDSEIVNRQEPRGDRDP